MIYPLEYQQFHKLIIENGVQATFRGWPIVLITMIPVMKATLKDQDFEVLNVSKIDEPNHGFVNGVKKSFDQIESYLKFSAHPI